MQNDPDTERLARAGRGGDPAGFAAAWRRVAPAVFAWSSMHLRGPLRQRVDPEDLLQEIACRAWSAFDTWDGELGVFRGWVFGIANNILREVLRSLAAEREAQGDRRLDTERWAELPGSATSVSRAVVRDEGLRDLVRRTSELPDDERRLLILRGLEGLSHQEVSEILSISSDAVAKRWQRLCERLRDHPRWNDLLA